MAEVAMDELQIDPRRYGKIATGIYVRARLARGGYEAVDITMLDGPSLLRWLRANGGKNERAENVVAILLDHGGPLDEARKPIGSEDVF
jgi:hypothetical protein